MTKYASINTNNGNDDDEVDKVIMVTATTEATVKVIVTEKSSTKTTHIIVRNVPNRGNNIITDTSRYGFGRMQQKLCQCM